ncbi:hypothetical protein DP939_43915 [Spongiactinospora rosea]|uniref:Uncharacterized protein n=1 Tax=Spongiactinospora rosea TaxID=2248750 RepID=A0A366LIZ2_9ACTN|nr:hypothetical protein [Spongiactinospora rosea]RBQ13841.1 hypothetical protein DP939_43915 [Spongiactinospora rosea]
MTLLSEHATAIPLPACPLLLVWAVEAGDRGASGVTGDLAVAERQMLTALGGFAEGRGRVRSARMSSVGVLYTYGETLVTARRKGGMTEIVPEAAWVIMP